MLRACMPRLLVIDDDPSIALQVRHVAGGLGLEVATAETAADGESRFASGRPDVVLLDVLLPDGTGLDVYQTLRRQESKTPIVFVTTRGASGTAIEAMRLGAFDFLVKPLDLGELRQVLGRAIEVGQQAQAPLEIRTTDELNGADNDLLVGRSTPMQQVYKCIGRVAGQRLPVLIVGEPGVGKQLVAQAIHQAGPRAAAPFEVVRCATSSESDVESLLFGSSDRAPSKNGSRRGEGKLDKAAGGTLFLDEISDLAPTTQARLLNYLQERDGAAESVSTKETPPVRLLAATSRDLEEQVSRGRFRADLYYLLAGCLITVPPLRDRLDDLPALGRHFLRRLNPQVGKRVMRFSPEALELLKGYSWPGNVAEFESVVRQALTQTVGSVVLSDFLPEKFGTSAVIATIADTLSDSAVDWEQFVAERVEAGAEDIYREALATMDRHVLSGVLRRTGGNQAHAARLLGMTRARLRMKLRGLGLVVDRQIDVRDDTDASAAG